MNQFSRQQAEPRSKRAQEANSSTLPPPPALMPTCRRQPHHRRLLWSPGGLRLAGPDQRMLLLLWRAALLAGTTSERGQRCHACSEHGCFGWGRRQLWGTLLMCVSIFVHARVAKEALQSRRSPDIASG